MKYRVVVILFILLAVAVTPALAKQIEDQIIILGALPGVFEADTPFFVRHGFGEIDISPGHLMQKARFDLYVDDVKCEGSNPWCSPGIPRISKDKENGTTSVTWEYKFKDGLPAGPHTLTGVWLYKCGLLYDPETCVDPEALVPGLTWDVPTFFYIP